MSAFLKAQVPRVLCWEADKPPRSPLRQRPPSHPGHSAHCGRPQGPSVHPLNASALGALKGLLLHLPWAGNALLQEQATTLSLPVLRGKSWVWFWQATRRRPRRPSTPLPSTPRHPKPLWPELWFTTEARHTTWVNSSSCSGGSKQDTIHSLLQFMSWASFYNHLPLLEFPLLFPLATPATKSKTAWESTWFTHDLVKLTFFFCLYKDNMTQLSLKTIKIINSHYFQWLSTFLKITFLFKNQITFLHFKICLYMLKVEVLSSGVRLLIFHIKEGRLSRKQE